MQILEQFWLQYAWLRATLWLIALVIGSVALGHILRRFFEVFFKRIAAYEMGWISDFLRSKQLAFVFSWFLPLLIFHEVELAIEDIPDEIDRLIHRVVLSICILLGAKIISIALEAFDQAYAQKTASLSRPIKGYIQSVRILIYGIALVLVISILINQSPVLFLSSLGALTAVFMLVFKDSLLSLVAGIQLTTNRLIQVGDWIEMNKFNANGTVIEIALNTVKVQNFDKTISVLPAHIFLENSFINWRGMSESGGRRIKRSINIDMTSIRFLTNDDISRFKKFSLLEKYMTEKMQSLSTDSAVASDDLPENHRRLTNIGTFRAYVVNYLNQNSKIRKDMTFIVRQLQPTAQGLPLEVYVFADETRWAEYEGIQADVFDHLLAIVNSFDLRVYQEPSGHDLQRFLDKTPQAL